MRREPASDYQIVEAVYVINQMIDEGKLAQALSLLYFMHKLNLKEWVLVKRELIACANTVKKLQAVATLLDASKKATLSESCILVPGLICRPAE